MRVSGHAQRWLSIVLGLVCLILVINLVSRLRGTRVGASRRSSGNVVPAGANLRQDPITAVGKDPPLGDPSVRLDLLREFQARRLPEVIRNPFEYGVQPEPAQPVAAPAAAEAQPPAPPPTSLKALGYAEKTGGVREAYLADQEQLHIAREGDLVGGRFRVLTITPRIIEIEDELQHQTIQLPVPQ